MKGKYLFFLVAIFMCATGCYKYERSGNVDMPGIALTFDDCSIDNWYDYLPLFDSFGVKATFYISNYHRLSAQEKNKLKEIQQRGHEIAYHTTFHSNLLDYLRYHGMDELMKIEIKQDMRKMNRDGFYPTTFAYPYGAHNDYLDIELLRVFKSVRVLNGGMNLAKSVTRTTSNTMLHAMGMDENGRSITMIERMMDLAYKNHNCLVLVGHQIEKPGARFQVSYQKLKFILENARNLGMHFYTVSEISN